MPARPERPVAQRERWLVLAVCLALAALTWLIFAPTLGYGFVNYDDDTYVYLQPQIVRGVTWSGVAWAFTHAHSGNWHPLTSVSHMLDCQLWGLNARGHHLSNLLLHTAGAIFLFLALRALTDRLWRSAFVAALFAVHPLRVESVAWVAERKDVLSGLFFMWTLLAYARYARSPSWTRYGGIVLLFACGLMSKPMLVTLPCVLLLLDYWPLRRDAPLSRLVLEKVPLFLLSLGSVFATLQAQAPTMRSLAILPLWARLENALVAIMTYLGQMIWPARLAVFYPLRDHVPFWMAALAAGFIGVVTILAWQWRRTRPYFVVGWFWYLGMLVPVLGIIQVGLQSHADRYTYLPQIGLYLIVTWAIADLSLSWKRRRKILGGAAAVAIVILASCASVQSSTWRDSGTLWRRALAVTGKNSVAETNLGNLLPAREALPHYAAALAIDPNAYQALNNLAWILAAAPDDSMRDGARAVELAEKANALVGGSDPVYLRTLGVALAEVGRFDEAMKMAERALSLAEAEGNSALAYDLRNNLAGYRLKQRVRDSSLVRPPAAN
ncbi:MAG TPA: hypothetical protein VK474_06010 [Chthoniobacterales bacterium]|nr:hypothetical protein [Chthoniobacterales bacterium]